MSIDEAIEALEEAGWTVNDGWGVYEVYDPYARKIPGVLVEEEVIVLATLEI